ASATLPPLVRPEPSARVSISVARTTDIPALQRIPHRARGPSRGDRDGARCPGSTRNASRDRRPPQAGDRAKRDRPPVWRVDGNGDADREGRGSPVRSVSDEGGDGRAEYRSRRGACPPGGEDAGGVRVDAGSDR